MERCYSEIKNSEQEKESADELQAQKKQKVKKVLEATIDMRPLNITFDSLLTETARTEDELIEVLKRLTEAQAQDKKKPPHHPQSQSTLMTARTILMNCELHSLDHINNQGHVLESPGKFSGL